MENVIRTTACMMHSGTCKCCNCPSPFYQASHKQNAGCVLPWSRPNTCSSRRRQGVQDAPLGNGSTVTMNVRIHIVSQQGHYTPRCSCRPKFSSCNLQPFPTDDGNYICSYQTFHILTVHPPQQSLFPTE